MDRIPGPDEPFKFEGPQDPFFTSGDKKWLKGRLFYLAYVAAFLRQIQPPNHTSLDEVLDELRGLNIQEDVIEGNKKYINESLIRLTQLMRVLGYGKDVYIQLCWTKTTRTILIIPGASGISAMFEDVLKEELPTTAEQTMALMQKWGVPEELLELIEPMLTTLFEDVDELYTALTEVRDLDVFAFCHRACDQLSFSIRAA